MQMVTVPVVKGKATVEIDVDAIPVEVYKEALMLGLKTLVNLGTSKITKAAYPVEDDLKAAAMAKAQEQIEKINTGKIRFSGGAKANKASGAVMTEARRIARNLVKDAIKAAGGKVSHVEASEITKAANALIAQDASIVEQAKAALEERAKKPIAIDVSAIPISEKLVKAAEARKAKDTLSKTQAGKPQARAKKEKPAQANA